MAMTVAIINYIFFNNFLSEMETTQWLTQSGTGLSMDLDFAVPPQLNY